MGNSDSGNNGDINGAPRVDGLASQQSLRRLIAEEAFHPRMASATYKDTHDKIQDYIFGGPQWRRQPEPSVVAPAQHGAGRPPAADAPVGPGGTMRPPFTPHDGSPYPEIAVPAPSATQPTERPAAQPTERPAAQPTERPATQPTERPAAQPAQQAAVPGMQALTQAASIMNDAKLCPTQALQQATPLFEQAIKDGATIDVAAATQRFIAAGKQADGVAAQYQQMTEQQKSENPALVRQLDAQYRASLGEQDLAGKQHSEPIQARLLYAVALNHVADQVYKQADGDASHKDELKRQADQMNAKAVQLLTEIGKVDPDYLVFEGNPPKPVPVKEMITGAIQQAQKHQPIDPKIASAFGHTLQAEEIMRRSTAPFQVGEQPMLLMLNAAGVALSPLEKVPGVRQIAGFDQFSPLLNSQNEAALEIANAKQLDRTAAKQAIDDGKQRSLDALVHGVGDVVSGSGGLMLAEGLVTRLGARAGSAFGPIGLAVGFGAAVAINKVIDYAAHKSLGTHELSNGELLAHSATSTATFGALKWLSGLRAPAVSALAEEGAYVGGSGSRWSALFKPSNLRDGLLQRGATLTEEGSLSGTLADAKVRRMVANGTFYTGTGALAGGLLGAGSENPLSINPQTGQRYTWQETGAALKHNSLMGGIAGGVVAPFVPGAARLLGRTLTLGADAEAGSILLREPTGSLWNRGARGVAHAMEITGINPLRRAVGRGIDYGIVSPMERAGTWLTAPEVDTANLLNPTTFGPKTYLNQFSRIYLRPMSLPISAAGGEALIHHQWDEIDKKSEQIIEAARKAKQ